MTHDDVTAPGNAYDRPGPGARARFRAAIRTVDELILALDWAIAKTKFEKAIWLRRATGKALSDAADCLASIADPAERADAVRELVAMEHAASRLCERAPVLSAAASAGNHSAFACERRAWIADRRAWETSSPEHPGDNTSRGWLALDDDDDDDDDDGNHTPSICMSLVQPSSADRNGAP